MCPASTGWGQAHSPGAAVPQQGYPQIQMSEQELEGEDNKTGRASAPPGSRVSPPVSAAGRRSGTAAGSTWVVLPVEGTKVSAQKKSSV